MGIEQIGQILLRTSSLDEDRLADGLSQQEGEGLRRRIGQVLIEAGVVSTDDVMRGLSEQWNIPYMSRLPQEQLSHELVAGLSFEFFREHAIIPLADDAGVVIIAMADPLDTLAFDAVVSVVGKSGTRAICSRETIEIALTECYYQERNPSSAPEFSLELDEDLARITVGSDTEDLMDIANRAPVVRLVNSIFYQAAQSRASDIHVEPYERETRVRFRIDGVLHDRLTLPKEYVAALVSRLKIMANLNIAERRLPQDGRSRIKISEREIDIRVSTIPTSGGERVVLRLLDKAEARFGLGRLGFSADEEELFRRLIHTPHGIVLLTGPTGSGKTTTLYAALSEINTEERNILTVEDPIEYQLPGVGQMQVQPKIGLTFASSLRHILRQDPNVIMVGEIRDWETAEIAIQAALTGHLVLSTLHTNDSASAVTRLLDMGVEPYLVASSVIGIIAQRLVRVICPACKAPYSPSGEESSVLLGDQAGGATAILYHGSGCQTCIETGYHGRTGIFELLLIRDEERDLIMSRTSSSIMKQAALEKGMRSLRADGIRKALSGETTLEEVLRVTQDEAIQYEE